MKRALSRQTMGPRIGVTSRHTNTPSKQEARINHAQKYCSGNFHLPYTPTDKNVFVGANLINVDNVGRRWAHKHTQPGVYKLHQIIKCAILILGGVINQKQ